MADGLDPHLRRIGATLRDKWTLERLIAVGGMAAVYVAVHKIGRRDAVKILRPEAAASRELVERFEQEAHAVNRFRHPGVVEVRDFDRDDDGVPFLVMELLEGESLVELAERRAPPLDEALRYLDELLDVLAAAHAHDIVHRDIKPDNLFITREGRLKVLDFGIARMLEGSPRSQRTAAGMVIGTPEYMSPEQVLGHKADARADIYSAGATFFWLLAGRHVHPATNDMAVMVKVMTEQAPPLCSIAPRVPPHVGLVIDRALAFRADDRYPDAQTMQQDVRAVRRGQAPPYASLVLDSVLLAAGNTTVVMPAATAPTAPAGAAPAPRAGANPAAPAGANPAAHAASAPAPRAGAAPAAPAPAAHAVAAPAAAAPAPGPPPQPAPRRPAPQAAPASPIAPAADSPEPPPYEGGRARRRAFGAFLLVTLFLAALGLVGAWFFRDELGIAQAPPPVPSASASPPPATVGASAPPGRTAPTPPRTTSTGGKPPAPSGSKPDKKKAN
jgi:eukaryotic-like serine/threonine-protein kinase